MNTDTEFEPQHAVQPATVPSATPPLDSRGLLLKLQEVSPTFRDCKPLALRIDKAIGERYPEIERKVIRTAMRLHTASTRYLKAMEKATARFDLDGKEDGEVTDEQRAHARQTLKDRFAESAKRQKAKREEVEAEQRRAEKLQQLLGKFSKD